MRNRNKVVPGCDGHNPQKVWVAIVAVSDNGTHSERLPYSICTL